MLEETPVCVTTLCKHVYLFVLETDLRTCKSKYSFKNKVFLQKNPDQLNFSGLVSLRPGNLSPPNAMSGPKNPDIQWCCAAVKALVISEESSSLKRV